MPTPATTCTPPTDSESSYCTPSSLVQTLCKKYSIWQTIRIGEAREECAEPDPRSNGIGDGGEEKRVVKRDVVGRKGRGEIEVGDEERVWIRGQGREGKGSQWVGQIFDRFRRR